MNFFFNMQMKIYAVTPPVLPIGLVLFRFLVHFREPFHISCQVDLLSLLDTLRPFDHLHFPSPFLDGRGVEPIETFGLGRKRWRRGICRKNGWGWHSRAPAPCRNPCLLKVLPGGMIEKKNKIK